jgi:hypothetical protein
MHPVCRRPVAAIRAVVAVQAQISLPIVPSIATSVSINSRHVQLVVANIIGQLQSDETIFRGPGYTRKHYKLKALDPCPAEESDYDKAARIAGSISSSIFNTAIK